MLAISGGGLSTTPWKGHFCLQTHSCLQTLLLRIPFLPLGGGGSGYCVGQPPPCQSTDSNARSSAPISKACFAGLNRRQAKQGKQIVFPCPPPLALVGGRGRGLVGGARRGAKSLRFYHVCLCASGFRTLGNCWRRTLRTVLPLPRFPNRRKHPRVPRCQIAGRQPRTRSDLPCSPGQTSHFDGRRHGVHRTVIGTRNR